MQSHGHGREHGHSATDHALPWQVMVHIVCRRSAASVGYRFLTRATRCSATAAGCGGRRRRRGATSAATPACTVQAGLRASVAGQHFRASAAPFTGVSMLLDPADMVPSHLLLHGAM
jgi:hypothetical protein